MTHHKKSFPDIIVLALLLNLFFLSYLALTSQLIIFHDSIGYQNIAEMFARGQWKEYLTSGPNREPLYSLLIAFSMKIAQPSNFNYLSVQIFIQVLILMLSQWLTYRLLRKLRISDNICAAILIYMGFSPGITSSGLILFSEIVTYPLVIWLVLALSRAWTRLPCASVKGTVLNGILIALPALVLTFAKGAFELIVPILLFPFIWRSYRAYRQKEQVVLKNIIVLLAAVFLFLQGPIITYKKTNEHFNGVYTLTDRAPEALYGNTTRRMQPLNSERLQTALVYMMGPDVCARRYGDRCLPWGFLASDVLGAERISKLREKGTTRQEMNKICIRESIPIALGNPLQYVFLSVIEGLKVFFWEAPELSYVVYTDAVDRTYNSEALRHPLRFALAFLSLAAFLAALLQLWKNKGRLLTCDGGCQERWTYLGFTVLTIGVFTSIHSIFFILPRYALPMAPLFLALIAWSINKYTIKSHVKNSPSSIQQESHEKNTLVP